MNISKARSSKTISFGEMLLLTFFLSQDPTQHNQIVSDVKFANLLFLKSV